MNRPPPIRDLKLQDPLLPYHRLLGFFGKLVSGMPLTYWHQSTKSAEGVPAKSEKLV